jgi:hypothetical protein
MSATTLPRQVTVHLRLYNGGTVSIPFTPVGVWLALSYRLRLRCYFEFQPARKTVQTLHNLGYCKVAKTVKASMKSEVQPKKIHGTSPHSVAFISSDSDFAIALFIHVGVCRVVYGNANNNWRVFPFFQVLFFLKASTIGSPYDLILVGQVGRRVA